MSQCSRCDRPANVRGFCSRCYQRCLKAGEITTHKNNMSGRVAMSTGYIRIFRPNHPMSQKDGYVLEHRMVAWDHGIMTSRSQVIHHLNHIRDDNRPGNLAVYESHSKHVIDHMAELDEVDNQYGTFARNVDVCIIEGCPLPTDSRNWCSAHYTRWVRTGDPLAVRRVARDTVSPYVLI